MNYLDRKQRLKLFDAVSNMHPRFAEECSFSLRSDGRIPYVPDFSDMLRFPGTAEETAPVEKTTEPAVPDYSSAPDYGTVSDYGTAPDYGTKSGTGTSDYGATPGYGTPEFRAAPSAANDAEKPRERPDCILAVVITLVAVLLIGLIVFCSRLSRWGSARPAEERQTYPWENPAWTYSPDNREEVSTPGILSTEKPESTEVPDDVLTGYLGERIKYYFYPSTGELRIGGNGEIPMPKIVNGYPEYPFNSGDTVFGDKVRSLVYEEGITNTGWRIGFQMYHLESVTLPSTLTQIDDFSFRSCKKLKKLNIPSNVRVIGREAFCGTAVTSAILPEWLTTVGEMAFADCPNLREIIVPKAAKEIGINAFAGVPKLAVAEGNGWYRVEENCLIDIQEKAVVCMGRNATVPSSNDVRILNGAYGMENLYVPAPILSIGKRAVALFSPETPGSEDKETPEKSHLKSIVFAGNSCLKTLEEQSLAGSLITIITLPDSLVTIGDGVFQECYGLTKLIIPAGVETVGVFRWSPYYLRLPAKEVKFLSPDTRLAVKDGVYMEYLDSDRSGIVVAYANSDAAAYANAFGLKFVELK